MAFCALGGGHCPIWSSAIKTLELGAVGSITRTASVAAAVRIAFVTSALITPAPRTQSGPNGYRSRYGFQELGGLHAQCTPQFDDVDQSDITFAPLDAADVVSMQVRQFGQAFLRIAARCPQFADALAKEDAWIGAWHLQPSCRVNTMSSTHDECDIRKR